MAAGLHSYHNDWLEVRVKEEFQRSEAVNSVLRCEDGVPPFPEEELFIRSAQAGLRQKMGTVDFMMDADQGTRPIFTFQGKLVSPSNRMDLLRVLLDGQPKKMGTPKQPQQDVSINYAEAHLLGRPSRVSAATWYWEFGQGAPFIDDHEQEDDLSLVVNERAWEFLRSLPRGMRGTDRFTWATRMAAGLREGKPLDIVFEGDTKNITPYKRSKFTVLDEERVSIVANLLCMVRGDFDPDDRRASLYSSIAIDLSWRACFRAAVDGPIKA